MNQWVRPRQFSGIFKRLALGNKKVIIVAFPSQFVTNLSAPKIVVVYLINNFPIRLLTRVFINKLSTKV